MPRTNREKTQSSSQTDDTRREEKKEMTEKSEKGPARHEMDLVTGEKHFARHRGTVERLESLPARMPPFDMTDLSRLVLGEVLRMGEWHGLVQDVVSRAVFTQFDLDLDEAESLCHALFFGGTHYATTRDMTEKANKELFQDAQVLQGLAMHWLPTAVAAKLIPAEDANDIRSGRGAQDAASDLQRLAPIYRANWPKLALLQEGVEEDLKLTRGKIERMSEVGTLLVEALARPVVPKPDVDWRALTLGLFTMLDTSYARLHAAVWFSLTWKGKHEEADSFLPLRSLYARESLSTRRSPKGGKDETVSNEPEPSGTTTETGGEGTA
jgi:hypothetical protein